MVWEEMSYNKYPELTMTERLRIETESEPDFIYTIIETGEKQLNEFIQANLFIFD